MKLGFGQKTFPLFLVFLFLSFLLILFDNLGILRPVRGGIERVVVPVKTKIYSLKQLGNIATQEPQEDEEKERKRAVLESQIVVLRTENEAMRRLLGAPLPSSWRFLPARVVGLPSGENLQIDKGKNDGVEEGMAVVFEDVFLGKVTWVGEHFSQVLLVSSSRAKILVVTHPSPNSGSTAGVKARGLLIGREDRAVLERVLMKEALDEGDLVATAGDENFPPDILIGKVRKVSKIEGEIYQKAEVELLVEPGKLETLFVVVSY